MSRFNHRGRPDRNQVALDRFRKQGANREFVITGGTGLASASSWYVMPREQFSKSFPNVAAGVPDPAFCPAQLSQAPVINGYPSEHSGYLEIPNSRPQGRG